MTTPVGDAWQQAHERTQRLIETHPRFNDLIRAVAAAECCLSMPRLRWLQRNSRTYACWVTRGPDGSGGYAPGYRFDTKARARRLCKLMTNELFPEQDRIVPAGEYEAKVRTTARHYAEARMLYHGGTA